MTEIAATYFDGRTAQARPVTLRFESSGGLRVTGDGVDLTFARGEVRIDSRLGNTSRFIRLPGDARLEVLDNAAVDRALATWGGSRGARWLHRLEASWRLALLAIAVMVLVAYVAIRFGLPIAARRVAFSLPAGVSERIGTDALAVLDKVLFAPSQLPEERREELHARFEEFLQRQPVPRSYELVFRASPRIGANAFALPNGTIVMTDELVALATVDDEIIAVLAHECGHVEGRHALRSILQNSAVVVVFTLATGDMSAASAVGAALPTLLLEAKYSRLFETEADTFGVNALLAAGLDPVHLANILERLTGKPGATDEMLAYISSHPATGERIETIKRIGQVDAVPPVAPPASTGE